MTTPVVARTPEEVARVVERCAREERIAVDVEGDGLFAYRAKLCTVQIATESEVFIVDALATKVAPLAGLLGEAGPTKILHDLTFDAKLLDEAGAPLARARDTSVAARLLGRVKTGLATLLQEELGVKIDKRFQHHDWASRPLLPAHLEYLAGDVLHLAALDDVLRAAARALDIEPEIDEESAHKLGAALRPPRDGRPGYVRIAAGKKLDLITRAVLREVCMVRERVAEARDVPPFKVVSNEQLLAVATARPARREALEVILGPRRDAEDWFAAILRGAAAGDVPEDERVHFEYVPIDRGALAHRRELEGRVTSFRRAEAARRGVDEQVVLPGHVLHALCDVTLTPGELDEAAVIAALGPRRGPLYGEALLAIARSFLSPP